MVLYKLVNIKSCLSILNRQLFPYYMVDCSVRQFSSKIGRNKVVVSLPVLQSEGTVCSFIKLLNELSKLYYLK